MYSKFPLQRILKGRLLKIAEMQDRLMIEASSKFGIVLHGGTAIWRMYMGKRFSFDIDVYYHDPPELLRYFEKRGAFNMVKGKLTGSDVLYMRFQEGNVAVEMQASPMHGKARTADGEFHLVGGDSIIVRTLEPADLLLEKISAFRGRRKARDLYDIFYLLDFADSSQIRDGLAGMLPLLKEKPKDFAGLMELILVGKVPDFDTIIRKVRSHAKG